MRPRPLKLRQFFLAIALVATGCSSSKSEPTTTTAPPSITGEITVFAASSLTAAFTEIGAAFTTAYPGVNVKFNFAGSSDLVNQINQGAPADVFASADDSNMKKLTTADGSPVSIAKNSMEIIVEPGNPKGIATVNDLAKPGLIVVLCAEQLPCGKNAKAILDKAGAKVTAKSLEDKVKGVVTKVTAGEADAGIVFVTDVKAARAKAAGVEIPTASNVTSNYPIAVIKTSKNAAGAHAFSNFVASPDGQAIMTKFGFLAP